MLGVYSRNEMFRFHTHFVSQVLRHCIDATKEGVHEAEMRLHRQPVSGDVASMERFRKLEMQRATSDLDLRQELQQIHHSWKKDSDRHAGQDRELPGGSVGPVKPTPIERVTAERSGQRRSRCVAEIKVGTQT